MQLNHDCVRDLMIHLEQECPSSGFLNIVTISIKDYELEDIHYAAMKLIEAGYLNGKPQFASEGIYAFPINSLTWDGHKFLDNIRDDGVWKDTKGVIGKLASVSISMVENISSQVITNIISKQMGLI